MLRKVKSGTGNVCTLTGVSLAARNKALLHTYRDGVGKLGISTKLGDGIDNTFFLGSF